MEKCIALESRDADAMLAASGKVKRLLMVAHVLPFFPEFAYARDAVRTGRHGHLERRTSSGSSRGPIGRPTSPTPPRPEGRRSICTFTTRTLSVYWPAFRRRSVRRAVWKTATFSISQHSIFTNTASRACPVAAGHLHKKVARLFTATRSTWSKQRWYMSPERSLSPCSRRTANLSGRNWKAATTRSLRLLSSCRRPWMASTRGQSLNS